jgi:holo-[acyl-carrier protein] synthase
MVCGEARDAARERGIGDILISIAQCRTYATAYAVAVSRANSTPKLTPEDPAPET